MKIAKLITNAKQFLGPLVCVTFAWLMARFTAVVIEAVKLWPWLDCSYGGCDLPPPPQTYVLTWGFAIIGLCVYVILGAFLYLGWDWFREGRQQKGEARHARCN